MQSRQAIVRPRDYGIRDSQSDTRGVAPMKERVTNGEHLGMPH